MLGHIFTGSLAKCIGYITSPFCILFFVTIVDGAVGLIARGHFSKLSLAILVAIYGMVIHRNIVIP